MVSQRLCVLQSQKCFHFTVGLFTQSFVRQVLLNRFTCIDKLECEFGVQHELDTSGNNQAATSAYDLQIKYMILDALIPNHR